MTSWLVCGSWTCTPSTLILRNSLLEYEIYYRITFVEICSVSFMHLPWWGKLEKRNKSSALLFVCVVVNTSITSCSTGISAEVCKCACVSMWMWMSQWCFLPSSVWGLTEIQRGKIVVLRHLYFGTSQCVWSYFKPWFSLTHSKWQILFERERASSFLNLWCFTTDGIHAGNSCSSKRPDSFAALTTSRNPLSFFSQGDLVCVCVCVGEGRRFQITGRSSILS